MAVRTAAAPRPARGPLVLATATLLAYLTSFVLPRGKVVFQVPGWVTPMAAGLAVATVLAIQHTDRPRRAKVGFGAVALGMLVWAGGGVPFDLTMIGGALSGNPAALVDWPMVATRALAAAAAIALFRALVRHRRAADDRCVHCGQSEGRAVVKDRVWLGYAGVLFALPYVVVKTNWALGGTLGLDYPNPARDGFSSGWLTVPAALIGIVLSLALVHRWGRVWPRWVPGLAGRPTPRGLLLFGGWFGTGLLLSVGVVGGLTILGDLLDGGLYRGAVDGLHWWPSALFYGSWLCWALVFAPATRGYQLRTQPRCASCGLRPDPA